MQCQFEIRLKFLAIDFAPDATDAADAADASSPPKYDAIQQPRAHLPIWNVSSSAPSATTAAAATPAPPPRLGALHGTPSAGKQPFISSAHPFFLYERTVDASDGSWTVLRGTFPRRPRASSLGRKTRCPP